MSATWMTPIQVAEFLSVSYETALAFIKNSGIKYVRIGRQYRVSREALFVFMAKNTFIEIE